MSNHQSFTLVHRDHHLAVVDKAAGLPIHKNAHLPRDHAYLTKTLGQALEREIYPVHRLDAKTSGIVVCAFSKEIAADLSRQFRERSVDKQYLALVKGNPGEGVFEHQLWDRKRKKKLKAVLSFETLEVATTNLRYPEEQFLVISLMRVMPETGRWHQIRMQFGIERHDILGDVQHGDWTLNKVLTEKTGIRRLMLHARSLGFTHPVSREPMQYNADLPGEFSEMWKALTGKRLGL